MSKDQDLADAILAMAKLSPGERATVISVVDRMRFTVAKELAEVKACGKADSIRREYTGDEVDSLDWAAMSWQQMSIAARHECVKDFANRFGRTEKAIRYQITSRLK